MPATCTSPSATTSNSTANTTQSVVRPVLSPRKRKFSDARTSEVASPTSLEEVASSRSTSSTSCSTSHEDRVISPKKKVKAEDNGNQSKRDYHVMAGVTNTLNMECLEVAEPISFEAPPAGDLGSDELQILWRFLA